MRLPFLPALLIVAGSTVHAAEQHAPATAGNLLQVVLGLIVVLGLMAAAAWLLKRFGAARMASGAPVRIIGGVAVGSRERIMVVEVADQWIVVGVAPGRISTLSTMPRQESATAPEATPAAKTFSAWLRQTVEKRNAK